MGDTQHDVYSVKSRVLLDYVSTPILPNSEHSPHYSPRSDLPSEHANLHGQSDTLHFDSGSAENQLGVVVQSRRFTSHKSTRQQNVHSWHGITNTQQPLSHNDTTGFITSRISQILRNLLSVSSTRNLSRVPTEEPDQSFASVSESLKNNNNLAGNQHEQKQRLDINTTLINETGASISVVVDREELDRLSSNHELGNKESRADKPVTQSKCLLFLGLIANYCVLGPLLVIYWNSTWVAFDVYLFPGDCERSSWGSAVIGFPMTIVTALLQEPILRFSTRLSKPVRYCMMRFYTWIESVVCINQWRSVWFLITCYTEYSLTNAAISLTASFVLLTILRSLRILPAPPVYLFHDVDHAVHYKVATFWESAPVFSLNFILDTIISVMFIQVLSITFWRGLWEVLDFCLLPDNPTMGGISSLGISLALTVVLLPVQMKMKDISQRLHKLHWFVALSVQDVVTVLFTVVCVTYWRGFWMLLDIYSPYRPESLFVAHGVSFIILALGFTANTVLVRGVLRDGIDFGDYGTGVDMTYVITLVQAWRRQRETKYRSKGEPRLLRHPVEGVVLL